MASRVLGPKTLISAEALEQYRRVKLDGSGNVVYADASDGDNWIGTTEHAVPIATPVAILLRNAEGTRFFVASATETVDAGNDLYPADDGKVTKTAGVLNGLGFQAIVDGAAAADGDIFEAIPSTKRGKTVAAGANLTALVPAASTIADVATAGGNTYSDAAINTVIAATKTALLLKADNVDVETLRTETEARLDAIEAALGL